VGEVSGFWEWKSGVSMFDTQGYTLQMLKEQQFALEY
jgi:hypothetical protein